MRHDAFVSVLLLGSAGYSLTVFADHFTPVRHGNIVRPIEFFTGIADLDVVVPGISGYYSHVILLQRVEGRPAGIARCAPSGYRTAKPVGYVTLRWRSGVMKAKTFHDVKVAETA